MHAAAGHLRVPGVINNEVRLIVRAEHDGVMAGAHYLAGNALQNPRAGLIAFVRIRAGDFRGRAVIDAIAFALVTATTVETVVDAIVLPHARAFEGVPIEHLSVHGSIRLKALPFATRSQDVFPFSSEAFHCDEPIHDQRGSRADLT